MTGVRDLRVSLGIQDIKYIVKERRLCWCGHVMDIDKKCKVVIVEETCGSREPRKISHRVVGKDL